MDYNLNMVSDTAEMTDEERIAALNAAQQVFNRHKADAGKCLGGWLMRTENAKMSNQENKWADIWGEAQEEAREALREKFGIDGDKYHLTADTE